MTSQTLPLGGVRVVEFSHMVMGPTCGMILGDLGAEVIKVEPIAGDNTRRLIGTGAGFFRMFNRNKKSIAVDLADPKGLEAVERLIASADVLIENFKPGTMAKYGLDYPTLAAKHPRLIYVAHKGFLPGPYEHRTALDEVVQMMAGLAYMTGPVGRPLRAGTSVNDIMGGMFGAIGVLAALRTREATGRGQEVQAALFENCVLLSGQHMQQYAVTGEAPQPMPSRISAWGIYDVFEGKGGEQIFLGVVSDTQWRIFCDAFGLHDLANDARVATNNQRVLARDWVIPRLQEILRNYTVGALQDRFEANALPYADRPAGAIVRRSASQSKRRPCRADDGGGRGNQGATAAARVRRRAPAPAAAAAEHRRAYGRGPARDRLFAARDRIAAAARRDRRREKSGGVSSGFILAG